MAVERVFRICSPGAGSAVGAAILGIFIYPHVTKSAYTTIWLVLGLLIGVAAGFGSIVTARKKSASEA